MKKRKNRNSRKDEFVSKTDPQGSWTGNDAYNANAQPVQDADDL
ncbi:MAG: hypothetical protein ACI4M8_00925 [Christensenellales bacterium]